ncbi:MAG: hypothetical protein Q9208_003899 [Pyrenodesmia sp. 3 TL-2023]
MHDFTNLRELVIGYEDPGYHPLVETVAEDLSIGLGRYLAGSGGAQLEVLKLEGVSPSDLRILTLTLRKFRSQPGSFSPPSRSPYSCPGSWPITPASPPLTSSSTLTPRSLRLQRLDITFAEHSKPFKLSRTLPIANLPTCTSNLASLSLRSPRPYSSDPSLVNLRAPPLPCLEVVRIRNFEVDVEAIQSLTAQNIERLQRIELANLSLPEGTWAEVAKTLTQHGKQLETCIIGLGYLGPADEIVDLTAEDKRAWAGLETQ